MTMTPTEKVYRRCRDNRGDDGAASIEPKEVATLIRTRLKARWPNVKFSVRSDTNSVHVHWTDGPPQRLVEAITGPYSFGGFDGMIDLAYSGKNWLLPDGTMEGASSPGTEGSRGVIPGYATDCPQPGAVLVKYGPDYVLAQRNVTEARYRLLARLFEADHGWSISGDEPLWNQRYENGEYVPSALLKYEWEAYEKTQEAAEVA